jgi:hypothetical protein
VNVRSRDSGVTCEGQLRAILSVGFGLSDGIFVAAAYGGFQPDPAHQPHRPAIFKNERQQWSFRNLGSAAIAGARDGRLWGGLTQPNKQLVIVIGVDGPEGRWYCRIDA